MRRIREDDSVAEQHLPANLCPLIKSTYGHHVLRSNPFLEMADLVVGETTCDGKKKMYELMAESRPMYVLELPHKSDDRDALEYWVRELEEFRAFLPGVLPRTLRDDEIREAIGLLNRERRLRRELAAMMKSDRPPLAGPASARMQEQHLGHARRLATVRMRFALFARAAAPRLRPTRRVRVLMTGVPMVHGAERVLDIVEHSGGLVVAMENCTGLKPLLEDVDARRPIRSVPWPRSTSICPVP